LVVVKPTSRPRLAKVNNTIWFSTAKDINPLGQMLD
jgi:hypothetical protein